MIRVLTLVLLGLFPLSAFGAMQTKTIKYQSGDQTCVGYLCWDDAATGKQPGVVVFHEWWGLNEYTKHRTEELAKLGYVAFAADLYGDGKTAEHPDDAAKMMSTVRANQDFWQQRALSAFDVLKQQPQVDAQRLGAMGYCFGGSTALELAYAGADLKAVITFHAGLPTPTEQQAKQIKPSIVICHGGADKMVTTESVEALETAFTKANVSWEVVTYGGAQHAFTVAEVDKRGIPGLAYSATADLRSWERMKQLFQEKLAKAAPAK